MPDLVTHFTIAYCASRPEKWAQYRIFFYMGTILPDVVSRPFYILFPSAYYYVYSLHSPVMVGLLCVLLSLFFENGLRKTVLSASLAGAGLHFILDLMQNHILDAYYWLFPFSWKTYDLGLFWPEDSLRLVPLWLCLMLVIEGVLFFRKRAHRERSG